MYETGAIAVGAAAAAATTDPGKSLPFTGAATIVLLVIAATFLTIGIALRVLAGRRSEIHP